MNKEIKKILEDFISTAVYVEIDEYGSGINCDVCANYQERHVEKVNEFVHAPFCSVLKAIQLLEKEERRKENEDNSTVI
jgi:hypothetical protein